MASQLDLKAVYVLRQNITTLLDARREDQQDLARWCGHGKSWINKFLNDQHGVREIQLKDLDRIASFFGVATYQLFQPGISTLTERRVGNERRTGRDRRIGHKGRELAMLRTEVARLPHPSGGNAAAAPQSAIVRERIQRILADAQRQLAAVYHESGEQAPTPRARRAVGAPGTRKPRGSAPASN